ncbi:hypothetical protein FH972_023411 [Carpinus fangiana]|uniref:Uncharacterized protein n=1 Tax=Carpinus fangiana TaxID=176857 RepID=A0A5N6KV47_9ROSI|nr:hypothetical protein FH972_023411 [Carpinus fangiana]
MTTASTDPAPAFKFPDRDATPQTVRSFLADSLVPRYGLHEAAASAAAKWVIGSGRELRDYPPCRFVEVFGRDDAWLVYRVVRPRTLDEWWSEKGANVKLSLVWFISIFALMSMTLIQAVEEDLARVVLIGGLGACWTLLVKRMADLARSNEDQAILELRQEFSGESKSWW